MRAVADPTQARAGSVNGALAGLSLSMLMSSLDTSIANAGLPALARAFHAPFAQIQWIVLAYLLAITTLIVGAGRLGDLVGRRRLLLAGIATFTGASVACGVASSLGILIAARAIQGLGAALMMALTVAFVGETVPRERMGQAMGLLGTMSAIGTAVGPSLGGVLISRFGWPSLFLVNLPAGVLALVLSGHHLPADRRPEPSTRRRFDVPGTLLLASSLAAYALALVPGGGGPGLLNLALISASLLGFVLLLRVESRADDPLLPLAMFRNPTLARGLGMAAIVSTVMMSTLVVGPFYLSQALGLAPPQVGLALSVGPLVVVLAGVPSGRIADRLGSGRTVALGLGAIAAGSLLLSLTSRTFGLAGYLLPIVLVTGGYALFQASNNTAVMGSVSADRRGVTSGLLSLSRNLGLITGASLMGAIFALASGVRDVASALPEVVERGVRFTFGVATVLAILALFVGTVTRRAGADSGLLRA